MASPNNKKTLPQHLTDEELLQALANQGTNVDGTPTIENKDNNDYGDPLYAFVQEFDLQPGKEPVVGRAVYKLFTSWNRIIHIPVRTFHTLMEQLLPIKRHNDTVYYYLNKKSTDIFKHVVTHTPKRRRYIFKKGLMNEVKVFTDRFDLVPGKGDDTVWVENDVLYKLYDNYHYENNKETPWTFNRFDDVMSHLFETCIELNYVKFYKVKSNIKNHLTKDMVQNWRQGRAKYGGIQRTKDKEELKAFQDIQDNLPEKAIHK